MFKLPRVLDGHVDYIKRLVGLPGDHVQLKNGIVYINGSPIPRTELAPGMGVQAEGAADNTGVYVVPPHCYFMMGDNRDNSLDSRFDPEMPAEASGSATCGWDPALDQYLPPESGVGFVPEEDLVGKAVLVLFSWDPRADGRDDGTRVLGLRTNRFARPVS